MSRWETKRKTLNGFLSNDNSTVYTGGKEAIHSLDPDGMGGYHTIALQQRASKRWSLEDKD